MMAQRLLNHTLTCSIEGQNTEVPLPAAYTRQLSYGYTNDHHHDPNFYTEVKEPIVQSPESEVSSLKDDEQEISTGKRQKSVLIFLRSSRFYIRALAILVMIASLSLILTAVIMFSKAQKKPGNPLSSVPQPAPITDKVSKVLCYCTLTTLSYCSESMSHSSYSHLSTCGTNVLIKPCLVFTGVAAMNLMLSLTVFALSLKSSKFDKSNNALNAIFAIISAVGFSTSMGACFL
jgi:hypothetical protein